MAGPLLSHLTKQASFLFENVRQASLQKEEHTRFQVPGPTCEGSLLCFSDESQRMLQVVQSDASKGEKNTDGAEIKD